MGKGRCKRSRLRPGVGVRGYNFVMWILSGLETDPVHVVAEQDPSGAKKQDSRAWYND